MNYERLNTFITVYEQRNFSDAAKILFVSQPTITSHIKALEEELESKLFERTTKKIIPTESARILYKYAKRIVRFTQLAQKEIRNINDIPHDDLPIGASMTIGEYILPSFLKQFKDQFPLITINTKITNSENIITQIKNRQIDIGLIETVTDETELKIEPILEDEIVLITPIDYQFQKKKTVTVDELKKIPLIFREKGSGTREVTESYIEKAGISSDSLQIVMELGSTESIKSAVEAGLGAAFVSNNVIQKELKLKLVKPYRLENLRFIRSFYIVYREDLVLSTSAELFLKNLKEFSKRREAGNLIELSVVKIN